MAGVPGPVFQFMLRNRASDPAEQLKNLRHRLFKYLCRLTGSLDDADELTQDVFTKAWKYEGSPNAARGEEWFFTAAKTTFLDWQRTKVQSTNIRHPRALPKSLVGGESPGDPAADKERAKQIRHAIERLKPDARLVLVLRDFEGDDLATIAEIIGCRVRAVPGRLQRARAKLRRLLSDLE